MASNLIRYLRDCFVEDNRRSAVLDVFARRVSHRLFTDGTEDVLSGVMSRMPVDPDEVNEVRQAALLYQRERELLYGCLFVVGSAPELPEDGDEGTSTKTATLCAPLLLYPAGFEEDLPFLYVRPQPEAVRVNEGLVEALCGSEEAADLVAAVDGFVRGRTLDIFTVQEIADLLDRAVPNVRARALADFPALVEESGVRKVRREAVASRTVRLLPASALVLASRNRGVRGVATELDAMAEAERYSSPVRVLLGDSVREASPQAAGHVPAVLSAAQQRVLSAARTRSASVVIGPPGTGKSFTIAAMALDHLSRGEAVLIGSCMKHAVDVVASKIEDDLGMPGCVMRGGGTATRRRLANYVRELLSGIHTADAPDRKTLEKSAGLLERLAGQVRDCERDAERVVAREISWSRAVASPPLSVGDHMRARWATWRAGHSRTAASLLEATEAARQSYVEHARNHLRAVNALRLAGALRNHRKEIQRLERALRARTSGRQANLFQEADLEVLLATFPIWLVTMSDVADILPLETEMFDLSIVDEATQCDVASAFPFFQRARRATVVGDPQQLRHLSFLSTARQNNFANLHDLDPDTAETFDYRNRSLLDVADARMTTQDGVAFLDEHFRSVPPIIDFSSRRFYAGRLRLMTDQPGQPRRRAFVLQQCSGRRDDEGVNHEEVERVVADIRSIVNSEDDLPTRSIHSIGVLSPFRSQVDAIAAALADALPGPTIERHRVMVGTAHTFQGEERDLMFLSMALDDAAHPAALRFLERPDIFNVSITRARLTQHLYLSLDPSTLGRDSLLRAYVEHVRAHESPTERDGPSSPTDSFATEVVAALRSAGLKARSPFLIGGLALDVVAYSERGVCGIDLLGYPGHFEAAIPLERYRMLDRAGMPVVPISYVRWGLDAAACLRPVIQRIAQD